MNDFPVLEGEPAAGAMPQAAAQAPRGVAQPQSVEPSALAMNAAQAMPWLGRLLNGLSQAEQDYVAEHAPGIQNHLAQFGQDAEVLLQVAPEQFVRLAGPVHAGAAQMLRQRFEALRVETGEPRSPTS